MTSSTAKSKQTTGKHYFKTEIRQLLDLIINSIYTNRDIFLRELISNASDAIDKARFQSLTDENISEPSEGWKIKLIPDKENQILVIRDNGIGMTQAETISDLGTIARSGTAAFLEKIKQNSQLQSELDFIGQFGVGFYSAFMVAAKVTVITKKAGQPDSTAVKWESDADGSFQIHEMTETEAANYFNSSRNHGTDVILELKSDDLNYLEEWALRKIVRQYSDYVEHPICMDVETEVPDPAVEKEDGQEPKLIREVKEEVLNSQKAIWLKSKNEISEEEYKKFYQQLTYDYQEPMETIHYRAEGTQEFNALLYIPATAPFNIFYKDYKIGPTLYIKRIQIMDNCEQLVPEYLRFIRGVVDSSDLPLNVSRETLQNNRQVAVIKKNITGKILSTLKDIKKEDPEKYNKFYQEFGRVLKEGLHFDASRREEIASLLLFPSTTSSDNQLVDLDSYIDKMPEKSELIYYLTAPSVEDALESPHLEAFREKDIEVLIMCDEIDDLVIGALGEYSGKKFQSIIKGEINLDNIPTGTDKEQESKDSETQKDNQPEQFKQLIELVSKSLKERVKAVRLSGRLKNSACCLVVDNENIDPGLEKLMKKLGQTVPESKRTLELNPEHPIIHTMNEIFSSNPEHSALNSYAEMLYNQALLLEGEKVQNPSKFVEEITRLMLKNLKNSSN